MTGQRVHALGHSQRGGETQVQTTMKGVGRTGLGPLRAGLPAPWLWEQEGGRRRCPAARGLPRTLEGETESSANSLTRKLQWPVQIWASRCFRHTSC